MLRFKHLELKRKDEETSAKEFEVEVAKDEETRKSLEAALHEHKAERYDTEVPVLRDYIVHLVGLLKQLPNNPSTA